MTKKIFFLLFILMTAGCALRHQEEIRRIQDIAREADGQKRVVDQANQRFEMMLKTIREATLNDHKTQSDFLYNFGEPVFIKRVADSLDVREVWLYRYVEQLWGSEKVYLYFDKTGNLVRWEHRVAESR